MRSEKLGFLSSLLCKWHSQATLIGKSVLPVLLLVRLVILGAAVHMSWLNDEEEFICNTQMPGCRVSCYNDLTPLAAPRLWTLQLVLVLAPGLVFLFYLFHLTNRENQVRRSDGEVKGHALGAYQTCMASVVLVEVAFVVTQSLLFGFWVHVKYTCESFACSHTVDCFVPHAWQKSAFLFIMFITSCVSLLLSAVELICVLMRNRQPDGAKALQSGSEVEESPCFLRQLLSLWHSHASVLGKAVLPVLQLVRLVIVGAAVQPVWDKDSSQFVCNTQQPGCSEASFNRVTPFSLHQYWTLQVVLILAPGLIFFCYLVHVIVLGKKSGSGTQDKGHVLGAYLGLLSVVVLLEGGFALLQVLTFGFSLSTYHYISVNPCPTRVECFTSQAQEKTVFMIIMFSVACLSGMLTLVELCVVLIRERPWEKQQNNKTSETSGLKLESFNKGGEDNTETKESSSNLNIQCGKSA